ncbi:hypothetical protein MNBD_NITROSPINAE03-1100 [hydrothermal vent metagenome]|uniref:histidine kinase n=1 Tax=hydrothermal vent metagenome TaxID=652676 RepID=A0A3B1CJ40_9ZZZZ
MAPKCSVFWPYNASMDEKLKMVKFLGQYLAASRSQEQILEMAMVISQYVLGYDHAIIRIVEGDKLISSRWIGFPREAADMEIKIGEGICGQVAKTGRLIIVEDTEQEPTFLKGVEGCRSELCAPLIYNNKTIGVFNIESNQPAFFQEQDTNLMETLATQVAAAIETARLREELSRAEKLSVVGTMASSILHDIRNDIHQLYISSDLLRAKNPSPERIEKLADMVRKSGENIYGLIEDIFEFVKTGESNLVKKITPLKPVLESIAEQVRSFAPENVEVRLDVNPSEGIEIEVDERRFRRVLLNLARNSVEAMPEGGILRLEAMEKDDVAVIEVKDTGIGIEKDHLTKIWEPLFTHGKKTGTGLGMAIVKKIVEQHGWDISVRSEVGKGTLFTIKVH